MNNDIPTLIIFIDALPYAEGAPLAKKLNAVSYKKVTPGIGYSINVKTELFAGISPDKIGYFCEWNYTGQNQYSLMTSTLFHLFHSLSGLGTIVNRVLHRISSKIISRPVYAIPFNLLPRMKYSGPTAYEYEFPRSTFISDGDFKRILYSKIGLNDEKIFDTALDKIHQEPPARLFISTAQLDGIMHAYGLESHEYHNHLRLITDKVEHLVTSFCKVNGEKSQYFIFSDHGMASVDEPVTIDIEKILGPPQPESYGYFIDATFLRVWFTDKHLVVKLTKELNKLEDANNGRILSKENRAEYELSDIKHGDIIFMLDEGKMFCPSFFGKKICKAMHGYDPLLESQQGVFLSNIPLKKASLAMSTTEIYKLISSSCS